MCRVAAYVGPKIPLENIVTVPQHSLLFQIKDAYESKVPANGDGFSIVQYGSNPKLDLYRDCLRFGLSKAVEMVSGEVIGILERMRKEVSIS